MRLKRKIPYIVVILLAVVYLAALIGAGFSNPQGLMDSFSALTGNAQVHLSSGSFPVGTTDLTAVVTPEDIPLLEGFTALSTADFSGSTCYGDIIRYQSTHPNVSVRYSVDFPNGIAVYNTASEVDLSGLDHSDVAAAVGCMAYLPQVARINMGTVSQSSASPVTADDIAYISGSCPYASLEYSVDVLGRAYPSGADFVDLAGLTSSQVPAAVSALSMLPNVSRLNIADNATTDGSLAWNDLTVISLACPNAALDYSFSVCGTSATMADTSFDLSAITRSDVDAVVSVLPAMNQLAYVNIGGDYNGLTYDDLDRLFAAAPDAVFSYSTSVCGKNINFSDMILDFNHIAMNDGGAAVSRILPYMRACTILDMDSCGVGNDSMAAIRDSYPDIEVIWRVWFGKGGDNGYSVRTNVETILASKPSSYGMVKNSDGNVLKYCTKVKNLDLGHNTDLSDVSFISYMPELENCILTCTSVNSAEPFRNCTKLDYLETGETFITDLSPLEGLTQMRYLNIGLNKGITDMSPLFGNTNFMKLYVGGTGISQDQINQMQGILDAAGNNVCDLSTNVTYIATDYGGYYSATEGMWRYDNVAAGDANWKQLQETGRAVMVNSEKYEQIREIFRYSEAPACYSAACYDPLYGAHESIY